MGRVHGAILAVMESVDVYQEGNLREMEIA